MGTTIGISLPYGYPGTISRAGDHVVSSYPVKSNSVAIKFGEVVVSNTDGTVSSAKSVTVSAANFAGIAVAQVNQQNTYPVGATTTASGEYLPEKACDVLREGPVTVKMVNFASQPPLKGGAVYVRTALATAFPSEVIGDIRATADGSNTVQITNCTWESNKVDANGIAELRVKTVNN